ncbi:nuclear transport factor 2 family protein [Kitasatospora sp. NPDC059571]|uniref:nuclear transport factor 2 family protein n=1 Tax=Kitasatospora sp. NPDC059571 TaxID=3346871 RepID=UPI00368E939F
MLATRVPTDLYLRVQQFYARQMQALDDLRFTEYAATFTEDGSFQHAPGVEPARGRAAILGVLEDFNRRFEDDPVQRRHWFNQIVLDEQEDGSLRSTVYTLVVHARPGVRQPEIAPSCVVHDVLEVTDGEVLTRSRLVTYDHLV